jgi:lysophospholipase L1-like esterase
MKPIAYTISLLLAGCILCQCSAQEELKNAVKKYGPPGFEEAIREFERNDRAHFPPPGEILVTGSSHIRMWKTIHEDLAPLTIIHRGYGGSTFNDAIAYAERIMIPYRPRAILIYSGNNDLRQVDPETVRDTCRAFVEKVRAQLPDVRFYIVSIPPAILGWEGKDAGMWPERVKTNRLIREYCDKAGLTWINVAEGMFDEQGEPRKEIFDRDDLHMKREGYFIWRDIILPVLYKNELERDCM